MVTGLARTWLVEGSERRRGGATPLVLLHGFTGDASTWGGLVEHLGAERTVLAIDLVGHGRSEVPERAEAYAMGAQVASVLAAVDEVELTAPVHWLGYSMGGRVALSLACAHPERVASLCLVGASPGLPTEAERAARVAADEALARFIEREGLEAFVERWMAHPLFASQSRLGEEHRAVARAQRLRNDARALAHTLRELGTGRMPPLWEELPGLHVPTLLAAGALDHKFTELARRMAERIPGAEVAIVPEAGHALHVEAPEPLARVLQDFLARC